MQFYPGLITPIFFFIFFFIFSCAYMTGLSVHSQILLQAQHHVLSHTDPTMKTFTSQALPMMNSVLPPLVNQKDNLLHGRIL